MLVPGHFVQAQDDEENDDSPAIGGLSFREIGPAFTSGRVSDLAVNPDIPGEYYVAVASGGVWKTSNWGNTYKPIFDGQSSYSIGCLALDPNNRSTVWVGTGENNNQRSVAYGDGVYKSEDGGASWKNMGLKDSEHIAKIIVHPDDPNTIYVAAYGPLWSAGGERGIYKSTNGGETWEQILYVDEYTGASDLVMDPEDPNTLYAAMHQRMRKVWTYLGGGPGSGVYKSTDGGKTWSESKKGLPSVWLGRVGLAVSPVDNNIVYAIVEAEDGKGGFFRSTDKAASWEKRSDYHTSGNYYQEIYCDPHNVDRVFAMDTWLHHTEDGGKNFERTGEKHKHVDNHAMWINPDNPNHWLLGCDGGIYETWDAGENYQFKPNLPITQFYKVAVDNEKPFYNIYGGTQDNNSMGGPSQTINNAGILNSDWYITNGGDGFESQIDPENPNIVYSQAQYGWLVRFDKKSGERVGIKPQPAKGEKALRWNWDAPLLISPHENERLYFCANKVFRSDDRGDSWTPISPDLTRQLDRNEMKIMGRVWGADAVMKNKSTSIYGNIVAFDESPRVEGLLYAGTDAGLIQVREPNSENWRKIDEFPGVPERTYVNMLVASEHDDNTVYAVFNNHKNGDFKPYILKSTNRGKSWEAVQGDLPERGSVYALAEDFKDPSLLFAGTEFGAFYSDDGGENWTQIKSGVPTIAVRDLAIQEDETDLVLGTFGRGFYVLDNYAPLREMNDSIMDASAHIFDVADSWIYVQSNPLGLREQGSQGESFYTAPNPPHGAVFTYYMKEKPMTHKAQRQKEEKPLKKDYRDVAYPTIEELRKEDREDDPFLLFVIEDANGNVVRKIIESPKKGVNRAVWNMRYRTTSPIRLKDRKPGRYGSADEGPFALPGDYSITMYEGHRGDLNKLAGPEPFKLKTLDNRTLPAKDLDSAYEFYNNVADLRRSIQGADELRKESKKQLKYIRRAILTFPKAPLNLNDTIEGLEDELYAINLELNGDRTKAKREFETRPSLSDRVELIVYNNWNNLSAPTGMARRDYEIAREDYDPLIERLHAVVNGIEYLEEQLDDKGVPYTPGRDDSWREE